MPLRRRWERALACAAVAAACASCAGEPAEGRPWIRSIDIVGNHAFHDRDIRERIALESTSWLPFAPKHFFDPVTLEIDRKRVVAFYAAHGYFFARVRSAEAVPVKEGVVDVRIVVDEGPPTKIEHVALRGLERLPAKLRAQAVKQLPLRAGEVFVHQTYLAEKGLIEARLRAAGYAWATAKGVARVDRARRVADVELDVDPGPRARFGTVTVVGPTRANRRAIARRAAFRAGRRFDPELLEATRGRIYALGLFSSVRVDYVRRGADVADVIVTVTPAKVNELRLGGGLGFERDRQELHARALYTRRNFLGGLRLLTVRLTAAYIAFPNLIQEQRKGPAGTAEATLDQPDFLARDLSLRVTAAYDLGIDYAFKFHGPRGALGLSWALLRGRLVLDGSFNAQLLNFFDTAPAILNDPTLARTFFGFTNPYHLVYFAEGVTIDLRDRPLDPRKGAYAHFAVEEGTGFLGSGFSYERVLPDFRFYLPLGPRVVFAARVMAGRIWPRGDEASPITRRFYAGGADSHRGFNYDRLSPQVPSGSDPPPVPVGGDKLLLLQGEARVDVMRIKGNPLGVVAFLDAGNVPGPSEPLTPLHYAVGGGLRYRTVIGTLRFDLGVRLNRLGPFTDGHPNPDPGQRVAFHLSIGEAF